MEILKKTDYRKILYEQALRLKRRNGSGFNFGNIAKSCQLQSPYLSKVFKCEAHLSEDQLYLIVEYLNFDEKEVAFIELLYRYQRSSIPRRRKALKESIRKFKDSQLKTEKHLVAESIEADETSKNQYFLNPQFQLVHLLLETKVFAKDPGLLIQKLNLSKSRFEKILLELEKLGLIKRSDKKISVLKNHFFLSKDSPIAPMFHTLMKNYASPRVQGLESDEKYGLSVLFHGSEDSFDSVRGRLVQLLKDVEAEVTSERSANELYQLSIDFFPWT